MVGKKDQIRKYCHNGAITIGVTLALLLDMPSCLSVYRRSRSHLTWYSINQNKKGQQTNANASPAWTHQQNAPHSCISNQDLNKWRTHTSVKLSQMNHKWTWMNMNTCFWIGCWSDQRAGEPRFYLLRHLVEDEEAPCLDSTFDELQVTPWPKWFETHWFWWDA